MKRNLLITLALISALFLFGFTYQASKPQAWEYKETCFPKDMNKLGADGWEMVSATSSGSATCLYFKRAK